MTSRIPQNSIKTVALTLALGVAASDAAAQQQARTHSGNPRRNTFQRYWDATRVDGRICAYGENPLTDQSGSLCYGADGLSADIGRGPSAVNNDGEFCVGGSFPVTPNGRVNGEVCVSPNGVVTGTAGFSAGPGAGQRLLPNASVGPEISFQYDPAVYRRNQQTEDAPRQQSYQQDNSPALQEARELVREQFNRTTYQQDNSPALQAARELAYQNQSYDVPVESPRQQAAPSQDQFRQSVNQQMEQFRQAVEYNRQNPLTINVPERQGNYDQAGEDYLQRAGTGATISYNENAPRQGNTFTGENPNVNYIDESNQPVRENRSYRADGSSERIGQGDEVSYSYRRDGQTRYNHQTGEPISQNDSTGSSQSTSSQFSTSVCQRPSGTSSETAAVRAPF